MAMMMMRVLKLVARALLVFLAAYLLVSLGFGMWAFIASNGNAGTAFGMFLGWPFMLLFMIFQGKN